MTGPLVLAAPAAPFWRELARRLGASLKCDCLHWTPCGGHDFPRHVGTVVCRPSSLRSGLVDRRPWDALMAQWKGRAPVRAVMLSSTQVYAPSHHHRGYVGEEELSGTANRVALSWRQAEGRFLTWAGRAEPAGDEATKGRDRKADKNVRAPSGEDPRKPSAIPTILRCSAMPASGEGYFWRLFQSPLAIVPFGYDPTLQFLAFEDLLAATLRALAADWNPGPDDDGRAPASADATWARIFNIVPRESIPLRKALRLRGVRRLGISSPLQRMLRAAPAALGLAASSDQLQYLRYPWTASGRRAREKLGFEPAQSSSKALTGELTTHNSQFTIDAPERRELTTRNSQLTTKESELEAATVQPSRLRTSNLSEPSNFALRTSHFPESSNFALRTSHDPFGMDPGYIAAYGRTLHRFWREWYWRIEVRGLEHVPTAGRAILVGVHRGFMPFDGTMLLDAVFQGTGRIPRFLVHPTLVKFPCLANYMTKLGGIYACQENADWVLRGEEILGMYPEGIRGAFTMYRKAYRLGSFGRDEFVRMALRNRAPLIPVVTVGSAEIFPILGRIRWRWFSRFTEWPFLPITPTFPLLPLPLPSKWHTRFLEPLHIEEDYPPEAADDSEAIRRISREVRRRMSEAIQEMLVARPSIWWGNIWE